MPDIIIPPPETKTSSPWQRFMQEHLPSPTILTPIFGVLLLATMGMGVAVLMTGGEKEVAVVAVPTPTPTPDPRDTWQEYTSNVYGMKMKIPSTWRIQEGVDASDTSLYFHSDETFGNLKYYVYVSSLQNPNGLALDELTEEQFPGISSTLKEEYIGENAFFLTAATPSRQGALTAYLPNRDMSYVRSFALTPYNDKGPYKEQERYERIFRQILSTVQLLSASPSAVPTRPTLNEDVQTPTQWKVYNDLHNPLSFDYPSDFTLDTSRQGRVWLNKQIEVIVTPVNPQNCKGICPVIEKESNTRLGRYQVKKYEGYITSEGGAIPQGFLQFVFREGSFYYMFTLYELPYDSNEPKNRTPQPIRLEDIQIFEQILATARFSR